MSKSALKFVIFFMVLLVSTVEVSSGSNQIRYTKAYGKRYVYLRDVARYYGMTCFIGKKNCVLKSKYSKIIFTYEKRKVTFNNTVIHLSHAPFLKKWQSYISEKDFLLLIDPLLRYNALPKHRLKTIMIDPGHGGKDTGAKGKLYKEKDIVLKISRRLRDILRQKGYRVVMTRNSDRFPSLKDRSDLANKMKVDMFISIHCNSASSTVTGVETFCVSPNGTPSTSDSKCVWKKENGNSFDKNNSRLAYEIQKSLVKNTKAKDRGLKRARFAVIKNVKCPGVLVEAGFLSNAREERLLGSAAYQDKVAKAVAEGIIRYHRELVRK